MVTINEQKIVAQVQYPKFKYVHIEKKEDGTLFANVHFWIYNELGEMIGDRTESYDGEYFNAWWASFNTGTYLYQTAFPQAVIPEETEQEFINQQGE
jgi:hypothetical protein